MTFICKFTESIEYSASTSAKVIFLISQFFCYRIRCLKTNAPNIISKAVRVSIDFLNALFSIFLVDLGCISRTNTMPLKENHDVLYIFLFLPTGSYLCNTTSTDIGNFKELVNVILYNIESFKAETSDYQFGKFWSDSLNQTTSQILLDTNESCWHRFRPRLSGELSAISLIDFPFTFNFENCTNCNFKETTDYSLWLSIAFHCCL